MYFEELIYRLKERFFEYFNSSNRLIRSTSRLLALAAFAAVISSIAPTLADELASSPAMQQPVVASSTDSSTAPSPTSETVTPLASPSPEPTISRPVIATDSPAPFATSSDSVTVVELEPMPLEIQPRYLLQIPGSVAVDPRASAAYLPHINIIAPEAEYTMACIQGSGLILDVLTKKASTTSPQGPDFLIGDRSNQLLISGTTDRVVALINSYGGLFVSAGDKGVAGKSLTYSFVAVTKPVVQLDFCAFAQSEASTSIRPLGISQSTVKGQGTLKR